MECHPLQQWVDTTGPATDWGAEATPGGQAAPASQVGIAAPPPATQAVTATPTGFTEQDWNVGPTTATKDWADEGDWGNTAGEPVSLLLVSVSCWCYYNIVNQQVSGGNW